jgi:hypothetical protein
MRGLTGAVLYGSIWSAVVLFVLGEEGKRPALRGAEATWWAWPAWAAGAALCAAHMTFAMGVHHGWSHQSALDSTALQTERVYGIHWSGGLYVNYAFLAAWLTELGWWRFDAAGYFSRPAAVTWLLRCSYFVILVNAVVVFASPWARFTGFIVMALLLWAWRPFRGRG